RIYHLTRLVFSGRHHHLDRDVLELGEVVAPDVLELDLQHAGPRPFAVTTEPHVAKHGREGVGADVVAELGVVEARGRHDRLLEHLQLGIGPRHYVIAERINAFDRPRALGTSSSSRPRLRTASSESAASSRNWSSR